MKRPLKISLSAAGFFLFSLLMIGCASTDKVTLDSTKRPRTEAVEVFKNGEKPPHGFKPIAEYSFLGLPEEEAKAMRQFIAEAKKAGANALLIQPTESGGLRGRFGHQSLIGIPHRVFKATAVAYVQ